MRILIVTQYIYPETFKSSEMAFELSKRCHSVEVLTGIPNYPEGHYFKGYGLFRKRVENLNGVKFYRCLQTPRKLLPGFLGLSLNYITFVINATLWVLFFFAWKKKYDAIITHEPSPITQIIPACILGDIRKTPVYSWIQDIWPDSMLSTVGEKGKFIEPVLSWITDWVYKHSYKLLITSPGMAELINRKADYTSKIIYYPQWAEDLKVETYSENILEEYHIPESAYKIMMTGSINDGIGVEDVVKLGEELNEQDVYFIFVGGGSEENHIREMASDRGLTKMIFTGRKPFDSMSSYSACADAMLLTLKKCDTHDLKAVIPARMQGYFSAGKPVLGMADGDAQELINGADVGFCVDAGDYKRLASYIIESLLPFPSEFSKKGETARRLYERDFTKSKCIDNLEKILGAGIV